MNPIGRKFGIFSAAALFLKPLASAAQARVVFTALFALLAGSGSRAEAAGPAGSRPDGATTFAAVGDFGSDVTGNRVVANLVKSWRPQFVITLGDNNYPAGSAATIDRNIGKYYQEFIYPYRGRFGRGAPGLNRFFPCLGNHDWMAPNARPYLDYFELPGNERYYSFIRGPVHLFCVDSDRKEPDGVTPDSTQGEWLRHGLAQSTSVWKVVYFHHAPYSSGVLHGSYTNECTYMRWPFKAWGASVVLSGHEHLYERVQVDGLNYIVNGLGGDSRDPFHFPLVPGSVKQFNADVGALRIDATDAFLNLRFFTWQGVLVDGLMLRAPGSEPGPPLRPRPAPVRPPAR